MSKCQKWVAGVLLRLISVICFAIPLCICNCVSKYGFWLGYDDNKQKALLLGLDIVYISDDSCRSCISSDVVRRCGKIINDYTSV